MSSPLIFRIVTNADLTGIIQTKDAMKNLHMSASQMTSSMKGSSEIFRQLSSNIRDIPPVPPATQSSLATFLAGLRQVRIALRAIRMVAFVGTFLAGPLIAAAKSTMELQSKLNPLITTLNQLGQSGKVQGDRFVEFAKALQKSEGIPVPKTLEALNVLISRTRSVADAEDMVLTARKINLATGQEFVAVVTALSEAMNGNASSLAKMTLKTEDYINSAVKAGNVSSTLGKAFEKDAARGAQSLSNRLARLISQVKSFSGELASKGTLIGVAFTAVTARAKAFESVTERLKYFNEALKKLRAPEAETPVALRNFEEIRLALTAARGEVEKLDRVVKAANFAKTTDPIRAGLKEQLSLRKQIVTTLEDLLAKERELSTAERQRIRDRVAELDLRRQEMKLIAETGGQEFLLDPDIERKRQKQAKKEEEIAVASVKRQRDAILAERNLTADDELLLEKELAVKLGEIRLREAERVREREHKISAMSPEELQKMREEEARAKRELSRTSKSRVTEAEVEFRRESNRLRQRGGAATGVTEEQKAASDRIETLRKRISEEKFNINLDPSFTPGVFDKLAKNAAQTFAKSYLEYIQKSIDDMNKSGNLSTAPVAGGET